MAGHLGVLSVEGRLAEISAQGDRLETLAATVDFEMFRPILAKALGEKPRWKGGRPGFDLVLKIPDAGAAIAARALARADGAPRA